ncbi:phage tail protein [Aquamicrobium sp.]|uniref:phage tail protein n=1 Tax=Aquamicrobium sp. TaxID=1872579 RepID=UPI00349EA293
MGDDQIKELAAIEDRIRVEALARIDEILFPPGVLDNLARQFNLADWDDAWPVEEKRRLILEAGKKYGLRVFGRE